MVTNGANQAFMNVVLTLLGKHSRAVLFGADPCQPAALPCPALPTAS